MKGQFSSQNKNPQIVYKHPICPFFQILKDMDNPTASKQESKTILHSTSLHKQSFAHNSQGCNQQINNQGKSTNYSRLSRVYSFKSYRNTGSIQMKQSQIILNKKGSIATSLTFTEKEDHFNGFKQHNCSTKKQLLSFESNKKRERIKSQNYSESPIICGSKIVQKGCIQWSLKKKKSRKLKQYSANKTFQKKLIEVVPIRNIQATQKANKSTIVQCLSTRQRSSSKCLVNTKDYTISQYLKIMKKECSYGELIKKKNMYNFGSPTQEFDYSHSYKVKYFEAQTEPYTPQAKKIIEFRSPKKQDFWIGKSLGTGRFGIVNIVQHKKIGFVCAMKTLSKKNILEEDFVSQFCREASIQLYLKHCNIVSLYGIFDDQNFVYLLIQLCLDGQLLKFMQSHKQIQEQIAVNLIKQICVGVEYLHNEKIIHRDLKPQNIIMHENMIKICDFGWAVYNKDSSRDTFCGTPLFLSPQMLKGQNYTDKIDNWAVGMISYQIIVGKPPFRIKTQKDLEKIISEQIQFSQYRKISIEAKDFIRKLLEKDEQCRIQIEEALKHPFLISIQRF